jgi:hypothetical protein
MTARHFLPPGENTESFKIVALGVRTPRPGGEALSPSLHPRNRLAGVSEDRGGPVSDLMILCRVQFSRRKDKLIRVTTESQESFSSCG